MTDNKLSGRLERIARACAALTRRTDAQAHPLDRVESPGTGEVQLWSGDQA